MQSPRVQESILEQISAFLNSVGTQKDSFQKQALTANVATALLISTKVLNGETSAAAGKLQSANAEKALQSMLHASTPLLTSCQRLTRPVVVCC